MITKKILITGAKGNLGNSLVRALLENNMQVIATVGSGTTVGIMDGHPNLQVFPLNVLEPSSCDKIAGELVDIDAIVMLVGGYQSGDIMHTTLADLDKMIDLNYKSAFNVVQPFYKKMLEKKRAGHFIFIGSRSVNTTKNAKKSIAYALSKSLVLRLAEMINDDSSKTGIKASVIMPGSMDTPPNRLAMPEADFSKWVTTDQVAEVIAWCIQTDQLKETVLQVDGN